MPVALRRSATAAGCRQRRRMTGVTFETATPRQPAIARPAASSAPALEASFVKAVERWEELPHNREGSDKSWVERLLRNAGEHLGRVRRTGG